MRMTLFLPFAALALFIALRPAPVLAHGGLPVSEDILWQGNTLYVPTQYWGIFVGTDGGEWRWICDEAINQYKLRQMRQGGDGTFYATDLSGLTLSKDNGCTWVEVAAPESGDDITQFYIDTLVPDPKVATRAYATGIASGGKSVLWRSEDAGLTWKNIFSVDGASFRGFALAPDGFLYALSVQTGNQPSAKLYALKDAGGDGGTSLAFAPTVLGALPMGTTISEVTLIAVDGRMTGRAYLHFQGDPDQVLAAVDMVKGTMTEVLRTQSPIFAVNTDVAGDRLLISTGDGVYLATGSRPCGQGTCATCWRRGRLARAACASTPPSG